MANTVTAHTILNGSRNLILQFNIVADASGEYSDFELLNVLDYNNPGDRVPNDFSVMKVSGRNGVGTTFQLKFGSSTNSHKLFFESTADDEFSQDWSDIGGLPTKLVSRDMGVRINTTGFDASADTLSLVIWLKKKTVGARD